MDQLRLGVIGTGSVVREIYQHLCFHSAYSPILSVEAAADPLHGIDIDVQAILADSLGDAAG